MAIFIKRNGLRDYKQMGDFYKYRQYY